MRKIERGYVCNRGTCFSPRPDIACVHEEGSGGPHGFPSDVVLFDLYNEPEPQLGSPADIHRRMRLYKAHRDRLERAHQVERDFEDLKARIFYASQPINSDWAFPPFGRINGRR